MGKFAKYVAIDPAMLGSWFSRGTTIKAIAARWMGNKLKSSSNILPTKPRINPDKAPVREPEVFIVLDNNKSTSRRQGRATNGLKEAAVRTCMPEPAAVLMPGTETAKKA
jgi:hypothetical protein